MQLSTTKTKDTKRHWFLFCKFILFCFLINLLYFGLRIYMGWADDFRGEGGQAPSKRGLNIIFFFWLKTYLLFFFFHKARTQTPLGRLLGPSINWLNGDEEGCFLLGRWRRIANNGCFLLGQRRKYQIIHVPVRFFYYYLYRCH